MFEKGSWIVCERTGICRVEEVGCTPPLSAADPHRRYYKLSPLEGNGTVYLPTDTKAFVRPVLTKEEVDALIASIPHIEQKKCDSENPHLLAAYYRTFLQSHQCESLIQLMKTAYAQTEDQEKSGRKPRKIDLEFQKCAEERLYKEFALVLGIPYTEVEGYIARVIEREEQAQS